MKTSSISYWLKQLRLPCVCTLCNSYHTGFNAVCSGCHEFFTPITAACQYCALPLPQSNFMICGTCIQKKPYFDYTHAPYIFEEPLRTLLHEFKYHQGLYLLSFLTKLMVHQLPEEALETECLIPVPMHPLKLRQRGFNQAAELAKTLSDHLAIPHNPFICHKSIYTQPQAGLNAEQRKNNLQNSFQVQPLEYKRITLIDDLITTGSTTNELAKTFKAQGVERVDVWCCARVLTSPH